MKSRSQNTINRFSAERSQKSASLYFFLKISQVGNRKIFLAAPILKSDQDAAESLLGFDHTDFRPDLGLSAPMCLWKGQQSGRREKM